MCLSRAKSHADSLERVLESAKLRRVTVDESKIVSYASAVSTPLLGLSEVEYESIRKEVTDVVHVSLPFHQ